MDTKNEENRKACVTAVFTIRSLNINVSQNLQTCSELKTWLDSYRGAQTLPMKNNFHSVDEEVHVFKVV